MSLFNVVCERGFAYNLATACHMTICGGRIDKAQAYHAKGPKFETRPNQANDLLN